MRKVRLYLNGWVWGIERSDGYVLMHEMRDRRGINYSKVFASKQQVLEQCADWWSRNHGKGDWRPFYCGQIYETRHPETAKGKPVWEDSMGQRVYVEEQRTS